MDASRQMRSEDFTFNQAPKHRNGGARQWRSDPAYLLELVELLSRHPSGLRRWSVMRALRTTRERLDRELPLKFEDEVERLFRQHCANNNTPTLPDPLPEGALFYKPAEKAGEVWAVLPERAKEWVARNTPTE